MGATPWRFKSSRPQHSKSKTRFGGSFLCRDNCGVLPFVLQTYLISVWKRCASFLLTLRCFLFRPVSLATIVRKPIPWR